MAERCNNLYDEVDVNMVHVVENAHVMERVQILTSILGGVLAGLFNVNLYGGILTYLGLHLIIILSIFGLLPNLDKYFMKKSEILAGLGGGILVFLCVWIITFNLVYTL